MHFLPNIAKILGRPGKVIVITPLVSFMVDQVRRLENMKIPAAYFGKKQKDLDVEKAVAAGHYDLVYMSPESAMSKKWYNLFSSTIYRKELFCIVIDECHCISKWYDLYNHVHS